MKRSTTGIMLRFFRVTIATSQGIRQFDGQHAAAHHPRALFDIEHGAVLALPARYRQRHTPFWRMLPSVMGGPE